MATVDEELTLAQRIRQGGKEADKARKRLVEANLRFVISVANQYHQPNMDLSDLISEGNIGLIKAAELIEDGRIDNFIKEKYSSYETELGQKIRKGETTLEELSNKALELKKPENPISGRQEYLEGVINNVLFRG